ncbi:DUF4174 domain-containing protein [Salinisphaera hydrothermalis]|uniref:DUF4174 domain-containing protein n=1 Tax=Salinisphaera hydrothermalis (strain C41B8) TaxID=1304275 RepID=A0A084IPX5_SALHC|nr:DUF4174 domain-containing protein [Salinisphaera hydrothermalis]KEZ78759.1 hypothetical protein C41B8_04051 [Salinisphaera hydrothermalis C41B8]
MRNLLFAVALAATFAATGCSSRSDTGAVPSLTGQYRVIAVFPTNAQRAVSLTNAFKSSPGLEQRDIAWFVLGPKKITSNIDNVPDRATLEKLHTTDGFQAVLIGKDGTLKASQLGGLDIQALLDAIDQMPLRQQEMQQQ